MAKEKQERKLKVKHDVSETPVKVKKDNTPPANYKKIKVETSYVAMVWFEGKEGYRISNWASKEALHAAFALPQHSKQAPVKEIKWFVVNHIKGTITAE